ncbi:MAG TPA: hypothetical protein PLG34_10195 [Spirochaetota bacterium]|jgi:hypothetical protein|nr:MAG: hypothetical protein BWX91_02197 [Spirochaetes bacterium ADurb.Bin133]HNZ27186.1 hypothetical protein [Spirochaetota bacterium]HPY88341.1 hypothetical protein [Spirochaetota bacterium]HQB60240.1 hypothetical protein [Spirochaetota bacterium]
MVLYSDNIVKNGEQCALNFSITNKKFLGGELSVYHCDKLVLSDKIRSTNVSVNLPPFSEKALNYKVILTKGKKRFLFPYTASKLNESDPYIVCDIDFTLSSTNIFLYATNNILHIKTIYSSQEVLNDLSEKYRIIYLTGRYNKYTRLTKLWLEKNKYPIGAIISRKKELKQNLEEFKTYELKRIMSICDKAVGIGDLKSDITAYKKTGIIPVKIKHPPLFYSRKGDYKFIDGYYHVRSWKGIDKLFSDKKFFNVFESK